SDKGEGNQEEFQPSGQMNKQGNEIPEKPHQSPENESPINTSKGKRRASNYSRSKMITRGLNSGGEEVRYWEKEEKEKDRSFEMAKLEQLALQEHIGKKYDLMTYCFLSVKRTEEIEQLENLVK
ncbi:hypothetical protein VP01_6155g2, partial [Puccinia sorghi]